MGALKDVGFLDADGNLTNETKLQYINSVVSNIKTGSDVEILGVSLGIRYTASDFLGQQFEASGTLNEHRARFPDWHSIHLDAALQGVASIFDQIPTSGVAAKIIPYFDPFQPIIDVLNSLKNLFPDFLGDVNVIDFLLNNLVALLFDIVGLIRLIVDNASEIIAQNVQVINRTLKDFINFIIDKVLTKLDKTAEELRNFRTKINIQLRNQNFRDLIINAIQSLALQVFNAPQSIQIPSFSLDLLQIPGPQSLQSVGPPPGIGFFYTQLIADFFTKIIDLLASAGDWLLKITQGPQALITYLIEQLLEPISVIISSNSFINSATSFAALLVEFTSKIIQMSIVAILGFLLGTGLITLQAANLVGLIQ